MDISEFDWRIEPLHNVIVGIDAGLAAIHGRLARRVVDGSWACEHAEPLLGLGFVAAQTYAIGTVSDLNSVGTSRGKSKKEKLECYAYDSFRVKGDVTRIQLINATANYFKHHDEWARWPTGGDLGTHTYDTRQRRNYGKDRIPVHRCCRSTLRHELGVERVTSNTERVASAIYSVVSDDSHGSRTAHQSECACD